MKILVTGGLGYIGSHTVVELINQNHEVVIVDNLSNSSITILDSIEKITKVRPIFFKEDITDYSAMENIFENHSFDGIIHFAGLKSVNESTEKPLLYYSTNVNGTIILAELCKKFNVEKFIFSSSATVYGNQTSPMSEDLPLLNRSNPYGESKAMCEKILMDLTTTVEYPKFVALLRYFNPIGAHPSGLIGDSPNGIPNNLMPYVTRVAVGKLDYLTIYGDDYETPDGTGVRDYIHVVDLAKGHIKALEKELVGTHVYNLGTGKGTSVKELVTMFEKANNIKIPVVISDRRPGDLATCYASVEKAKNELNWEAEHDIFDMLKSAWHYESNYKE